LKRVCQNSNFLFSLRSRRTHKAWGASPRESDRFFREPASARDSAIKARAVARYHGLPDHDRRYLGLAPQALCIRLLRRLKKRFWSFDTASEAVISGSGCGTAREAAPMKKCQRITLNNDPLAKPVSYSTVLIVPQPPSTG